MNIMLLFMAVLVAGCVWWFLQQKLTSKPWTDPNTSSEYGSGYSDNLPAVSEAARKMGLWFFLAVITSLFSLLIVAYSMRKGFGDWQSFSKPNILLLNTFVLMGSSITFQFASNLAKKEKHQQAKYALYLAGLLTFTFVFGQYHAWLQISEAGYSMRANPANAFFYLLTAIHVLHLLGGIIVWIDLVIKSIEHKKNQNIALGIQLCARYWHFLLVVWFVILGVLWYT